MTDDLMAGHIRCASCASAVPIDVLPLFQGSCPYCLGRPKPYETETVPAPAGAAATFERSERRIRPVDELAPGTPPEIVSIVHKCLAHQPGDRYGSAAEISADIDRWRTGRAVDAHSRGWAYRAWRFATRRRWAVASVLVVVGICASAYGIEVRRERLQRELAVEVAEKWVEVGKKRMAQNDVAGAREAFTRAIALDPKARTYLFRSFTNWQALDMQACLTDTRMARALDPSSGAAQRCEARVQAYIDSH